MGQDHDVYGHGEHPHTGHGPGHPHQHNRDSDDAVPATEPPAWADTSIPDAELSPSGLSRRQMLRAAGLLGAGAAAMSAFGPSVAGAAAAPSAPEDWRAGRGDEQPLAFLAGDHHIHTQSSPDGLYRVSDQVRRGAEFGLDWMVITDHGSVAHSKIGVERVNPDIRAAREANRRTLVFQGLEWNIPAAEHGTVFVAPGANEVAVLKAFEQGYDGVVTGTTDGAPGGPKTLANEALAITGLQFLAAQKASGAVADALMFANHPARKGIDSPHEIRAWRDAAPGIAMGMEGAPGHQAAAIPGVPGHAQNGRGYYDNNPSAQSFPGYPLESYVTYGGFDAMTSTVGGLWDSLLAEGRPWWVTSNSDSHAVFGDTLARGAFAAGQTFDTEGRYPDPIDTGVPNLDNGDFFPGFYSRTHVGAAGYGYLDVMTGLRAGRVWVDHGNLIDGIDVRLAPFGADQRGVTLGGSLAARRGWPLQLTIRVATASRVNFGGELPSLARVDVIQGDITGPASDRDAVTAPTARVTRSFDTSGRRGVLTLSMRIRAEKPFYLRLRGTDGRRSQPGLLGSSVDPSGPSADVRGDADPWADLWFYTNPIFIDVRR